MSVYMIIEIQVTDHERYSEYVSRVPEILKRYGGRYLARGGQITTLSGDWYPERIVLIEFETLAQLRQCFRSPEYLEIAPLRQESTTSRAIIVEGVS